MVSVEDERDLEDQDVVGNGGSELPQMSGGGPDQLVVLATLHLFVQERVVGGQGAGLTGPELAAGLEVAGVEPELGAGATERLPPGVVFESARQLAVLGLESLEDPGAHGLAQLGRDAALL